MARLWLLVSLLCGLAGAGWAADIQVTAELNPPDFAQDQAARLTVTVNGSSSAEPELPEVKGLHFRYIGQSQQTSWINGAVSASVAFSFAVQAEKPGRYTISPIKVRAEGKEHSAPSVACAVSPARSSANGQQPTGSSSPPPARVSPDEAKDIGFLRIIPASEEFYPGQLVPFTIKAYFRPRTRLQLKSAPRFLGENFLLQGLDKEPQQLPEIMNGEQYTALIWQGALSAVKEGAVALAVELDAELLVRDQGRRGASPLFDDPFFDNFFDNYSPLDIKFASPPQTVTVRALPDKGRPADFKGAVGLFSLAVAASPTEVGPGEPVTLKMRITGNGNFDLVQAPELSDSKGWKIYPATARVAAKGGGKGEKSFEQAIIPIGGGLTAIPPLRFSYFDPAAGDYVTLSSEPIPLHLQGGAAPPAEKDEAQPQQRPPQPAPAPPAQKKFVSPPRPEPGDMVRAIRPLYEKRWFQTSMVGAGCCLAAGLLLDLRRKKFEGNPDLLLRKQAERQAAVHCQAMKTAAAAQDEEGFRRHCLEAVRQRAGGAWGRRRRPESITLADLQAWLAADSPLLTLFARLEQSGYAGARLSPAEMEEIAQTARQELDKLA